MNKGKCKVCLQDKYKIAVKVYSSGTIHWVDENGDGWYGNVCPSCRAEYKREKYAKNKLVERTCSVCNELYLPKRFNQKRCSKCKL
jgi:hypothetical protein